MQLLEYDTICIYCVLHIQLERISRLKVRYATLQDRLLKIIHHEMHIDIYRLQAFIQQLPVILEDPRRKLSSDECQEVRRAAKIFQIFATLGRYIDYNKYHLLEAVVCTFGNPRSRKLMNEYVLELESPVESHRYLLCPNCEMEKVRHSSC